MDGAGSSSAGEGGDYDDEPVLKYQRMGADVGSLLSAAAAEDAGETEKETVVRMAVHDTCLVGRLQVMIRRLIHKTPRLYACTSVAVATAMLLLPTFVECSMCHFVGLGASSTHAYLASEHGAGGKRLWVRIPPLLAPQRLHLLVKR